MQHEIYAITAVGLAGPYTLKLTFDDGTVQVIDFRPVLEGEIFGKLQDPELFAQVRLDAVARTIVWPNGADFDPATLHDWNRYENEIVAGIRRQGHAAETHALYGSPAASTASGDPE